MAGINSKTSEILSFLSWLALDVDDLGFRKRKKKAKPLEPCRTNYFKLDFRQKDIYYG